MLGIYEKYTITKTDGTPIDPKAQYFVLRLDTDLAARIAAVAYAAACEADHPELAADLRAKITKLIFPNAESMVDHEG